MAKVKCTLDRQTDGRTDRQTERQIDGQTDRVIPIYPPIFVCRGYNNMDLSAFNKFHGTTLSMLVDLYKARFDRDHFISKEKI